jgi:hypothetical protein
VISPTVEVALIAAAPPTMVAICSLIVGFINKSKIQEVHLSVNSRLTELLEATRKGSFAEGQQHEKDKTGGTSC